MAKSSVGGSQAIVVYLEPLEAARQEMQRTGRYSSKQLKNNDLVVETQRVELDHWASVKSSSRKRPASEPAAISGVKKPNGATSAVSPFANAAVQSAPPPPPSGSSSSSSTELTESSSVDSSLTTQSSVGSNGVGRSSTPEDAAIVAMFEHLRRDHVYVSTDLIAPAADMLGANIEVYGNTGHGFHMANSSIPNGEFSPDGFARNTTYDTTVTLVNEGNMHYAHANNPADLRDRFSPPADGNCFFHALAVAIPDFLMRLGKALRPYNRDAPLEEKAAHAYTLRQHFVDGLERQPLTEQARDTLLDLAREEGKIDLLNLATDMLNHPITHETAALYRNIKLRLRSATGVLTSVHPALVRQFSEYDVARNEQIKIPIDHLQGWVEQHLSAAGL